MPWSPKPARGLNSTSTCASPPTAMTLLMRTTLLESAGSASASRHSITPLPPVIQRERQISVPFS